MSNTMSEIISWDVEVDLETANQIKSGVPPWIAITRAVDKVQEKRKNKEIFRQGGQKNQGPNEV